MTIFVTCPVCGTRTGTGDVKPGSNEDEAAVLLGASGWQMFRRVTLPNIRWAPLYEVVLTNAHAQLSLGRCRLYPVPFGR